MSTDPAQTIAQQIPPSIRLAVEDLPIATLVLGSRQLRIRKKSVLEVMGANIRQFGFVIPVTIDGENRIICGKGRVQAARLIGMTDVGSVSSNAPAGKV